MGVVKSGRGIEDSMGSLPGHSFASNCNTDTLNIGPSPNLGPMQGALHMGPLLRGYGNIFAMATRFCMLQEPVLLYV